MQVQETMYLQMQGPQKPLPRIPPAFPHGTFGATDGATGTHSATSKVGEVGVGVGATHKLPSRPGNSTAGLLSVLAVGAATMITQFRPSKRLSQMRRARMARRFRSYQWEEAGKDGREVRLYIPVDQTIKEKHVEIDLSESKLRVSLLNGPPVIDSDLYDSVHPHESHWFIDRHGGHACVAVTLMKKNMWTQWPFLTTQEAAGFSAQFWPWQSHWALKNLVASHCFDFEKLLVDRWKKLEVSIGFWVRDIRGRVWNRNT